MGGAASRVKNTVTRPIREYNLYERAHKAVVKNKYVPSPKHPSTQKLIENTINELPTEVKEHLSSTDPTLQEHLRQVYVTSQDIKPIQPPPRQHPDRPLPLDRAQHGEPEYGFVQPKVVPYGKVTLKSALEFITAHQNDPESNTADSIALKHKLDQRLTERVLHHFGTFRLFVPPEPTAQQKEMLKQLKATNKAIPNNEDLQRRLQGVAMSDKDPDTLPLHQFPESAPAPAEVTLLQPYPEGRIKSELDLGAKDTGMEPYVVQAEAVQGAAEGKESVAAQEGAASTPAADDATPARSGVPIGKNKNADAT